ncbi:Isocitrate dehydrogenase [NADP] [compost metagenome]
MYWAQELAAQTEDTALQAHFSQLAKTLTDNEATIIGELSAVQGTPVDIAGYYRSSPELTSKVMRPSPTFNAAIASLL